MIDADSNFWQEKLALAHVLHVAVLVQVFYTVSLYHSGSRETCPGDFSEP